MAKTKEQFKIGAMAPAGYSGEIFIYGGIPPGANKPIWVSPYAPRLMTHFEAAAWATAKGGNLPTKEEGNYLGTIRGKGAFRNLYNTRSNWFPPEFFWLGESHHTDSSSALCHKLKDSVPYFHNRNRENLALCILR